MIDYILSIDDGSNIIPAQRVQLDKNLAFNSCGSPKINLNCRDGPSEHGGKSFWNNSAASGQSDGRSDQFCSKPFADKVGQFKQCTIPRLYSAPRRNDSFVRV